MARQGGGSHLPTGHGISSIVYKYHQHPVIAHSGIYQMLDTDSIRPSVAHISDADKVRPRPFCSNNKRNCPAMMCLDRVQVEKIPRQQGASYITTEKNPFGYIKTIDSHAQCFENQTVAATGTELVWLRFCAPGKRHGFFRH